jgi:murein DD-endopeptidase MepM/ murein hydrolase activator NlpD
VYAKQHARPVARVVFSPLVVLARFLVRFVGIPSYRFMFWARRYLARFYFPAKHRMLYVFSNRYVFHVAIVGIAALSSTLSVQGSEVRAETFGERSLLFALVNQDDSVVVEEVTAGEVIESAPTSYIETYVVSTDDMLDIDLLDEEYVTTTLGGSALLAPTISDEASSVAPRTDVETYVVQEGDTASTIAESFGLSLSSVLWANNLTARSTIRPGQELTIPPIDGVIYTVKSGDTINSIAKKYSAEADTIIAYNKLADADDLQIGEDLIIPGGEPPKAAVPRRTAPLADIFKPSDETKGAATGSGTWLWPTDWRVITQYYGWRHVGLDIDGGSSNYNYASRAGTVTRASWFGGYGLCVEVDHGDGYVTRYGHFARIDVAVGDWVDAGESLGLLGSTGRSTGSHLHFEVIKDGKRQNPLEYIR